MARTTTREIIDVTTIISRMDLRAKQGIFLWLSEEIMKATTAREARAQSEAHNRIEKEAGQA